MQVSGEYCKRIFDFQKRISEELKRPVSFSEAVALMLTQTALDKSAVAKKQKKLNMDSIIYWGNIMNGLNDYQQKQLEAIHILYKELKVLRN